MELWLRETLQSIIGIFPIVFDKALAFAKPLYGFDVETMDVSATSSSSSAASAAAGEESSDWTLRTNVMADKFEADVMGALHKYEKVGAVSIAVLVDAVGTSDPRPESGFCPSLDSTTTTSRGGTVYVDAIGAATSPDAAMRQQFPAVYLRTLSLPVPPSPAPGSPRYTTATTVSSPAASPRLGSSPRLGMRRRMETPPPPLTVPKNMQYDSTEGGGGSWPHSEWAALVNVLTGGSETSVSHQTVFFIENLSESMWLVAMMKNLGQPAIGWQHWHSPARPTTEAVEDDLRELVTSLASMIRISDRFRFTLSSAQNFQHFLERSSDEIGIGLAEELKERGLGEAGEMADDGIFRLITNQLKVLASANSESAAANAGNLSLPRSRLLRGRRGTLKHRLTGHTESAAAFFLGNELMHTID